MISLVEFHSMEDFCVHFPSCHFSVSQHTKHHRCWQQLLNKPSCVPSEKWSVSHVGQLVHTHVVKGNWLVSNSLNFKVRVCDTHKQKLNHQSQPNHQIISEN